MRTSSTDQGQGHQARRLSSNNPFRQDAVLHQQQVHQSDREFQEWVSSNAMYSPYGSRPATHKSTSLLSFSNSIEEQPHEEELLAPHGSPAIGSPHSAVDPKTIMRRSMTPPQRPASKNPFLVDISPQSASDVESATSSSPQAPAATTTHPTAQEEKERLRRRYLEQTPLSDSPSGEDLPPSYEEVAGPKKNSSRPREKSSSSRHNGTASSSSRSHRHRSSRESSSSQKHSSGHRRSSKDKKGSSSSASSKPLAKNVDTIDKLDVTGLFGGAFHHDGPFDACTPHRNRNNKVAPVMAFPKDGPNSSIAGAANSKSPMKEVFGQDSVDDDDTYLYKNKVYSKVANSSSTNTVDAIKPNSRTIGAFDAKGKTQLVHGPTTEGLGSTTFLDGAPATGAQATYNRLHPNHRQEPLHLTRSHSGHLEYENVDPDEDVYLGGRMDPSEKKSGSGNKFMRRVKSLKVGRKA
ncbi:LADA_0F12310g1_1 [Lachancea dasiensis]|uniref:LADA_0F12310g1_1 n=1 Tax=Lachancea dasiensis TaxID=1072105 RepID=A0A1G4JMG1_9SACH|nr:LADA_0F12310g1_1 [Lachancea dasiensis]